MELLWSGNGWVSIFTHFFMLKSAQNKTPDPIQMKLRQNKKVWNKQVSTFINDLIHFKKTMNGAPSKFSPEKGTIKNPIPGEPASILEDLSTKYQDIAQKGNGIIQEQIDYSKNRRKSQPKTGPETLKGLQPPAAPANEAGPATVPGLGPAPMTGPDLTKQLAASFEDKYEMVVEGSNFLSRFITRLTTPTIGFSEAARIRRARMDLLGTCVKVYKGLIKMQVEVTKSSKDSIPATNKLMYEVWNNWTLVSRGFGAYKATMPADVPDSGGQIPEPQEVSELKQKEKESKRLQQPKLDETPEDPNAPLPGDYDYEKPATPEAGGQPEPNSTAIQALLEAARAASSDYIRNYQKLDHKNMGGYDSKLEQVLIKLRAAKGAMKPHYSKKTLEEYKGVIDSLNRALGTTGATMADVFKQLEAKQKGQPAVPIAATAQLETVAQALLRKWLGRTWHQLNPFDKTSNARLNIYNVAEELRKLINRIMDSLEKDMNVEELTTLINEGNRQFSMLRGLMRALHLTHPMQGGQPKEMALDKMTDMIL